MATVKATFGGKPCYAEGSNYFNLEPGVTASTGVVTMRQGDLTALNLQNSPQDLLIDDGANGSVRIKGLYVIRSELLSGISFGKSASRRDDNIMSVHVADKRYLWQFTDITGHYNVLADDGISYIANTTKSGTTPHTLDELLQKCWDELGIDVSNKTGVEWTPQNVHWEFTTAAIAAGKLLQNAGWTIAWNPESDSYTLLDLTKSSGGNFSPSGTIISHAKQARDRGAERPKTAKVAFRVLRQKSFTMEAVLEHDGKNKGGASVTTAAAGEWQPVATVLSDWGINGARVNKGFYSWFATNQDKQIIDDLGGGELGRSRLQKIRDQYYRVFRVNNTDRDSVVPLIPINPEVGKATGRTVWTDAKPGTNITYHMPHRVSGQGIIRDYTGRPPFDVTHVNPRDGVVAFVTPNDTPVTGTRKVKNSGLVSQDYELEPGTVTVEVAYFKKFSDSSDPTADYHLVTKDLSTPNNEKTKVFLAPHAFLREIYDSDSADFTKQNQTELETEANNFLDRYAATFDMPDPEEYLVAGVESKKELVDGITAIRWNATDGVTTLLRLNDRFGVNPLSIAPAARARQFALAAEPATLLTPATFGGSGKGGDIGSLDNYAPILKDHGTTERTVGSVQDENPNFVNDAEVGLLVASDRSMEPSGENPCKKGPAETGQRPTQTTKSPRGGGVQVSGGPADGVGGKAGG